MKRKSPTWTPVECPRCGRMMRPNCLAVHVRAHDSKGLLLSVAEQERIVEVYGKRGATIRTVAAEVGWSQTVVQKTLHANGAKVRPPGGGRSANRVPSDVLLETAELYRLFSLDDVAEMMGVCRDTVRYRLKLAGTKMRPQGPMIHPERRRKPQRKTTAP